MPGLTCSKMDLSGNHAAWYSLALSGCVGSIILIAIRSYRARLGLPSPIHK